MFFNNKKAEEAERIARLEAQHREEERLRMEKVKHEAEEKARLEAEEKARIETEERRKRDMELATKLAEERRITAEREAEEKAKRDEESKRYSAAVFEMNDRVIAAENKFFETTDIKFVTMNESNMVFCLNNKEMVMIGFNKTYIVTFLHHETYSCLIREVSIKAMDLFYHSHI